MSKETMLDCCGLACPQPVLRVKEALEAGAGQLTVRLDNEAAKNNVLRFASSQGCSVQLISAQEDNFVVSISASSEKHAHSSSPTAMANSQCDTGENKKILYVIAADSMGRGSEELGWALLQTYIQTIKEVQPLPEKILFYNSGVKLVTEASGALSALLHLQEQGVEILACGACLDFFKLKSAIKVGQISNMFAIMSAMMEADKIISPF